MVRAKKTAEIIVECKRVREERGWSLQRVLDEVRAQGGYTSFSSVKRFFAEGSENSNFNYEETVLPIARAMLGIGVETPEPDGTEEQSVEYYHQIEGLKSLVELKNAILLEKEAELQRADARREEAVKAEREHGANLLALAQAEAQKKLDFLKGELAKKDRMVRRCLFFCAGVLVIVLIYALLMDAAAPTVGLLRG